MFRFGPYDEGDAADDTDSSEEEVQEAWHQARDDAEDDSLGGDGDGDRNDDDSGWD